MNAIRFSVSYSLNEYLSFVQDHAAVVLAKEAVAKGKVPKTKPSALTRGMIAMFASIMFLIKKHRMPVCEFEISEQEIRRRTADGELVVAWAEVLAVHKYSRGYLVEKKSGAMPLPYRSLSAEQASELALLIQRHEGAQRAPARVKVVVASFTQPTAV